MGTSTMSMSKNYQKHQKYTCKDLRFLSYDRLYKTTTPIMFKEIN